MGRRKKKPVEEEEPVVVAPVVEVESAPPVVEEELLEAPEEIVEVESAPPLEEVDGPQLAGKDKVRDEFKEKDKKPKGEAEKIVIKPAVLKVKGKPEEEESSSEEEEEEEKAPAKKKLSKADLKPAVQIKMAAEPEAPPLRRKKKDVDEEPTDPFAGLPAVKPKIKDEFTEKDKKPKDEEKIVIKPAVLKTKPEESSSEEEEEEPKPEPKKKLSRSDLKPAVQIKIDAAPEPAPTLRRKKKEVDEEPTDPFAGLPAVKPKEKIKDEFTEKDKKPKEEEKIVIKPAVLPTKPEESSSE